MKKLALAGCAVLLAGLSAAQEHPHVTAVNACVAAWQSKNLDKIIADCKKATEANELFKVDWPGANYYLAKAYFSRKDYANSVAQYKAFLELSAKDEKITAAQKADAQQAIGAGLFAQKKFADAIPYLVKTIGADPNDHRTHYWLADAYRATKQAAKAEQHYVKVTALNPKTMGAFYHAGMYAVKRKDNVGAKKYLSVFAKSGKGAAAAQANYFLGQIAYEEGDADATKSHWEAYLASNPKANAQTTAVQEYLAGLDASKETGS